MNRWRNEWNLLRMTIFESFVNHALRLLWSTASSILGPEKLRKVYFFRFKSGRIFHLTISCNKIGKVFMKGLQVCLETAEARKRSWDPSFCFQFFICSEKTHLDKKKWLKGHTRLWVVVVLTATINKEVFFLVPRLFRLFILLLCFERDVTYSCWGDNMAD